MTNSERESLRVIRNLAHHGQADGMTKDTFLESIEKEATRLLGETYDQWKALPVTTGTYP